MAVKECPYCGGDLYWDLDLDCDVCMLCGETFI